MPTISLSKHRSQTIKGLAIIAVVIVHILAYLPGIYHGDWQLFYIGIDQLARFCVPAFLMISGYGLMFKYQAAAKINYLAFLKNSLSKLLPLYLLWSLASIFIIKSVPAWSFANQPMSIWVQLLFGQADYQLYFVPVLLQLYLLFPLLWRWRKYLPRLLPTILLLQAGYYYFFISGTSNNERFEYVFALSWVGYFVAGMYLFERKLPEWLLRISPWLASLLTVYIVWSGQSQINAGVDPLPVLKFTKVSVIALALAINLSLASATVRLGPIWQFGKSILVSLGQHSYLIFLSHTLALRLLYSLLGRQLDGPTLLRTSLVWLGLVWLSLYMSKSKKI